MAKLGGRMYRRGGTTAGSSYYQRELPAACFFTAGRMRNLSR
jgi:hypothetical protein